jgi:nuclear pore complex protein Nup205
MSSLDGMEGLRELHESLEAFSESRLNNFERLLAGLEGHIEKLKTVFEQKPKNDQSRRALASGKSS